MFLPVISFKDAPVKVSSWVWNILLFFFFFFLSFFLNLRQMKMFNALPALKYQMYYTLKQMDKKSE